MLSDNFMQFDFTSNSTENAMSVTIRRNPFDYDTKDSFNSSSYSNLLQKSSDDSVFVNDHFDHPLSYCNRKSTVEELTIAVKECKLKILHLIDNQESKDKLIERLIELNEALHTAKERKKEHIEPDVLDVVSLESENSFLDLAGHKLVKRRNGFGPRYCCEVCQRPVRTARSFYHCQECDIYIHASTNCIQGFHRVCPAADLGHPSMLPSQVMSRRRFSSADSSINLDIDSYPITGNLVLQKFLCAECNYPLKPPSSTDDDSSRRSPPKFCHYFRKFYCYKCHWDNKHVIPAVYFMLNKWKEMSVCRSAYIKLRYIWDRALFRMPSFWEHNCPGVGNIFIIRKKLFNLRLFIHKCPDLTKISESSPLWLIEQPYLVTMNLVGGISNGISLETVQALYSSIVVHILQCQVCQQLCSPCHLCNDPESLSVMSRTVWTCTSCTVTCIHEKCATTRYKEKTEYVCPNCSKD